MAAPNFVCAYKSLNAESLTQQTEIARNGDGKRAVDEV